MRADVLCVPIEPADEKVSVLYENLRSRPLSREEARTLADYELNSMRFWELVEIPTRQEGVVMVGIVHPHIDLGLEDHLDLACGRTSEETPGIPIGQ
jgi:hypothetical protein